MATHTQCDGSGRIRPEKPRKHSSIHREVSEVVEVHNFTYGIFNPLAAYLLAFLGSFFGLLCTARARDARAASKVKNPQIFQPPPPARPIRTARDA